jgi:hypothetical protein
MVRFVRIRARILLAIFAGTVLLASTVAEGASQKTSARVYRAYASTGSPAIHVTKTVKGSCFTGSIEANRNDAWRCTSGTALFDPCFSSSKATGIVICVPVPWKRSGVELKLTRLLPTGSGSKRTPSTKGQPWGIETTSGLRCVLEGMGPFVNKRVFADYACKGGQWLWVQPDRKTKPWTIATGKRKPTATAKVKTAWF